MTLKLLAIAAVIVAMPLYAQAQQKPAAKPTKADAQRIVQTISGDKNKTQKYCELSKLGDQMDEAEQKKDNKKVEELSKKADDLMNQLGPEYASFMDGLQSMKPESKESKEIGTELEALDKLCAK